MAEKFSELQAFFKTQGKGISLLLTIVIGMLVPQGHVLSQAIQYLLIVMLFFAFLDIDIKPQSFPKNVFWILIANSTVAFFAYAVLAPFSLTLALAAFMTAIAPTAIAAPVITGFIRGEVEYVIAAVLLTNLSNALIVPLALPFLLGQAVQISVWEVLQPVLIVMFVPLLLAQIASRLPQTAQTVIRKGKVASFPLWLVNLFIISAKASDFLRAEAAASIPTLLAIALTSLGLCIVNFSLGALLGGRRYWQEASQSLGQKNLSFVIWIALAFINPLVATGPMFYIIYHHLYNSWSIYQFERKTKWTKPISA